MPNSNHTQQQSGELISSYLTRIWLEDGILANLLKGRYSIAKDYLLGDLTPEQIAKLSEILAFNEDSLNQCIAYLNEPFSDSPFAKYFAAFNLTDSNLKNNLTNLLKLKERTLTSSLTITNEQLVQLAKGEFDDFTIIQNGYGDAAIDSEDSTQTSYVLCNQLCAVIPETQNSNEQDTKTARDVYNLLCAINNINNQLKKVQKAADKSLKELQIKLAIESAKSAIEQGKSIIDGSNETLSSLKAFAEQTIEVSKKAYSLLPLNYIDTSNDSINKLLQHIFLDVKDEATLLITIKTYLASRPSDINEQLKDNSTLLSFCKKFKEERLSSPNIDKIRVLEQQINANNAALIKKVLSENVWQAYFGLSDARYVNSILQQLCRDRTLNDLQQFILAQSLSSSSKDNLYAFIKRLRQPEYRDNGFIQALLQAPESTAIFNEDITIVNQEIAKLSNKYSAISRRANKWEQKLQKSTLRDLSSLYLIKKNLLANPLAEKPSLLQKVLNLPQRAWTNIKRTITFRRIPLASTNTQHGLPAISSLAELRQALNDQERNPFTADQLLYMLYHTPVASLEEQKAIKHEIITILQTKFKLQPDYFTTIKDISSFYRFATEHLKLSGTEFAKLVANLVALRETPDKLELLRAISSARLEALFKEESIALADRFAVLNLCNESNLHQQTCAKALSQLVESLQANLQKHQEDKKHDIEQACEAFKENPGKKINFSSKSKIYEIAVQNLKENINNSSITDAFYTDFCRGFIFIMKDGKLLKGPGGTDTSAMKPAVSQALGKAKPEAFNQFINSYNQTMLGFEAAISTYLKNKDNDSTDYFLSQIDKYSYCSVTETGSIVLKSELFIKGFRSIGSDGTSVTDITAPAKFTIEIEFTEDGWSIKSLDMSSYTKDNSLLDTIAADGTSPTLSSTLMINTHLESGSSTPSSSSPSSPRSGNNSEVQSDDEDYYPVFVETHPGTPGKDKRVVNDRPVAPTEQQDETQISGLSRR